MPTDHERIEALEKRVAELSQLEAGFQRILDADMPEDSEPLSLADCAAMCVFQAHEIGRVYDVIRECVRDHPCLDPGDGSMNCGLCVICTLKALLRERLVCMQNCDMAEPDGSCAEDCGTPDITAGCPTCERKILTPCYVHRIDGPTDGPYCSESCARDDNHEAVYRGALFSKSEKHPGFCNTCSSYGIRDKCPRYVDAPKATDPACGEHAWDKGSKERRDANQ